MRRTVIGIVLAAALANPTLSMAAPRHHQVTPTSLSWWGGMAEWTGRLLASLGTSPDERGKALPCSGNVAPDGTPTDQSSTTIDDKG